MLFLVKWGGVLAYSVFTLFLIPISFSSCNESEDLFESSDSIEAKKKNIELHESDGFTYASDGRSVAVYGLDDNTDCVNLVIPSEINGLPVKEIASYAFQKENSIVSVEFPSSLTRIGEYAFYECENLLSVTIPDGVTTIEHAFTGCTSLKSVKVPKSVTAMDDAFNNCTALNDVLLEDGITVCSGFSGCSSLTQITIPSSVKIIGRSAFYNYYHTCAIKEFNLPENLEIIEDSAFYGFQFENITLPARLKKIGASAFQESALTHIELPASLEEIDSFAFYESKLSEIALPDGLSYLGESAFGKTEITEINIPPALQEIPSRALNGMKIRELYLPATVKKIGILFGDGYYDEKNPLTKITIACNLLESAYDEGALGDGSILNMLYGEPKEEEYEYTWTDENNEVHAETDTRIVYSGVDVIFEDSVKEVSGRIIGGYIKSLTLGKNTRLKNWRFDYGEPLKTFIVTSDGQSFENCNIVAEKIVFNADAAFYGCTLRINKIYMNTDISQLYHTQFKDDVTVNDYVADIPSSVTAGELIIADGVKVFSGSFEGILFDNVHIPDSVELHTPHTYTQTQSMGVYDAIIFDRCVFDCNMHLGKWAAQEEQKFDNTAAFAHCIINGNVSIEPDIPLLLQIGATKIATMVIPALENVRHAFVLKDGMYSEIPWEKDICYMTKIGTLSVASVLPKTFFSELSSMTNKFESARCSVEKITFSSEVTVVDDYTFINLSELNEIDLSNVTYIGERAFESCTDLKKVIFGTNPTIIKAKAFQNCKNAVFDFNGPIVLDENSDYCFDGCSKITSKPVIHGTEPEHAFTNTSID